jgi:hypothetical protein
MYYATSYGGKVSRDEQILYELIAEYYLTKAFKNLRRFSMPREDKFMKGIITILATQRIPICLIFSSQIQYNIRHILESEAEQCHQELQRMGSRVQAILRDYIEFAEGLDGPLSRAIGITFEVECWITGDFAEPRRTELHRSHGVSENDIEPFYCLLRHPILVG